MSEPNLQDVDKCVQQSGEQFLEALKIYEKDGPDDGRAVTERFLSRFLAPEPKRSPYARDFATEAIQRIQDFGSVREKITTQIADVRLLYPVVVTGLSVETIAEGQTSIPGIDPNINDPTEALLKWRTKFNANVQQFQKRNQERLGVAAEAGNRLCRLQRLSASLLLLRQTTLRVFRRQNLELTIPELRRRFEDQLKEASKDEVLEQIVQALRIVIEKAFKVAVEETIFVKVTLFLVKLWQALRGRIDTRPGGTDKMEQLLADLRGETALLNDVERTYRETVESLRVINPQAHPV